MLNHLSECFLVNAKLTQGFVMSPSLFNVYMEGVEKKVNARVLRKGLQLLSVNGGRFKGTVA